MSGYSSLGKFIGKRAGSLGRRIYTWLHPERADAAARLARIERTKARAARRAAGNAAEEGTSIPKKVAKLGTAAGVTGGVLFSDPFQFNVVDPVHYRFFSGRSPRLRAQPGDFIKWQNKKRGWSMPEEEVDEESAKIKQAKEDIDKSQPQQTQPQQTQQQSSSISNMDLSIYN